ncbi:MAG: ABC transporter ATP-binding protein [Micavibrio aeruginosavorus]|uniref:ABC transporter ATP-binding protein n=1 Tax=Micavibrio aeruginosavorus TaxID=349221 RepID=A0A7T5R3C8_9BACT|nr:MAG: ABC transporter ATP-binding protein [Micavibrio aeruginosavorus]
MQNFAIDIQNLGKTYRSRGKGRKAENVALRDVTLQIPRGSMFGLLGPNGAGKSTIINIMAGLVNKTSGSVRIWDIDIDQDLRSAKAAIGVVPQELNFDPFFTPAQLLDIQAGMYGVPKAERRTMDILKMMGLADKAGAYTRSLSGGMRRRLMVAKAMVHNPPILVLDEPTAGVDVELRQQLWENVRQLNRQGVTVLLTTHYLEEAQELCDTIAIINHGRIIACEEKETLLARVDAKEIHFRLDRPVEGIPAGLAGYHTAIKGRRTLTVRYRPGDQQVGSIIAAVQSGGYGIVDLSTDENSLEDVFLQLTSSS